MNHHGIEGAECTSAKAIPRALFIYISSSLVGGQGYVIVQYQKTII